MWTLDLTKFNKNKFQVLLLERKNLLQQHSWQQLCYKGPGVAGRQQSESEPAECLGSQEAKQHLGLY